MQGFKNLYYFYLPSFLVLSIEQFKGDYLEIKYYFQINNKAIETISLVDCNITGICFIDA
jgi:hypothetical protein